MMHIDVAQNVGNKTQTTMKRELRDKNHDEMRGRAGRIHKIKAGRIRKIKKGDRVLMIKGKPSSASFWEGLGSVMDIYPSTDRTRSSRVALRTATRFKNDAEALRVSWQRIGVDFWRALKNI